MEQSHPIIIVSSLAVFVLACNIDSKSSANDTDSKAFEETPTDTGTGTDTAGNTDGTLVVLSENFDNWDSKDERFTLEKGKAEGYVDNNTKATVEGHECLAIHAGAEKNGDHGFSVEFQMTLEQQADMRGEDFSLSFDIYVPAATHGKEAKVQFSFWEIENFTPIYSKWYDVNPDEWTTIETLVDSAVITYNGFTDGTNSWIFDAMRVQTIVVNGSGEGDEVQYYVDNLKVYKEVVEEDTDDDIDTETETLPSPYTVTIGGHAVEVQRVSKFEVPVNYIEYTYPGSPVEIQITGDKAIGAYTLSPKALNIQASVTDNTLSFTLDAPRYLVLQIEGSERLLILMDKAPSRIPLPENDDVKSLMDYEGVDNTGETEMTEILQKAIDDASGSTENILYVPAGIYASNSLFLRDDMTLYLAEGAVLKNVTPQIDLTNQQGELVPIEDCARAFVHMAGIRNAKLMGPGTLDGNGVYLKSYNRKMFLVKIENSADCTIDGVLSRDACFWNTLVYRSDNITIENYKVLNNQLDPSKHEKPWNETDGVDFDNCTNSVLKNALLYTGDDSMSVKSDDLPDDMDLSSVSIADPSPDSAYIHVDNILYENVVAFSASSACKIGTKTFGDTISGVTFRDIDVISCIRAMVIDAKDTATITGTQFDNLRIENVTGRLLDINIEALDWRNSAGACTVNETKIKDVASDVNAECRVYGLLHDQDTDDPYSGQAFYVNGIAFENLSINGNPIESEDDPDWNLNKNAYVTGVTF